MQIAGGVGTFAAAARLTIGAVSLAESTVKISESFCRGDGNFRLNKCVVIFLGGAFFFFWPRGEERGRNAQAAPTLPVHSWDHLKKEISVALLGSSAPQICRFGKAVARSLDPSMSIYIARSCASDQAFRNIFITFGSHSSSDELRAAIPV